MTNSTHPLPEVRCGDAATHLLRGTRGDGSAIDIYSSPACDDSIRAYLELYGYTVAEVTGAEVDGCGCGSQAVVDDVRAENERLAETLDDAIVENAELAAEVERLKNCNNGLWYILWGELSLDQAKAEARRGRRLKDKLHHDPRVTATWEAFHDALTSAIRAGQDAKLGEAL
ncbi:hypothetical protein L0U85_09950 [Glycomyces sp. L485]|uniref:hypothetical protein n=1 Tax=Glycomyces sp. L485 TaxID=2909235 RepID=UPI001F4A43E1|nr:hypothetical protein [Glycomyces sp. L485]MCH7231172.1 hypothetical protein [Glycomyces sp. L485]